ncbi:MAG: hypothetical protein GEU99_09975 [Luteitalea sp.]|nr:hypothetical protein [Luteitalea sp.]
MTVVARADLETLLRTRKFDRTLLDTGAPRPSATAETGLAWLDAQLGGGFPRGETSEIAGPRSSGRTGLLHAALAAATGRAEAVAIVDPLDRFDPVSAMSGGVQLEWLLWVRGPALSPGELARRARSDAHDLLGRALTSAIKASDLILQAGGFGLVVLDLADAPRHAFARMPFTTWLRLQRSLEGRNTVFLIVTREPVTRSAGGVSLRLACAAPRWQGKSDRARLFAGFDMDVHVATAHKGARGQVPGPRANTGVRGQVSGLSQAPGISRARL